MLTRCTTPPDSNNRRRLTPPWAAWCSRCTSALTAATSRCGRRTEALLPLSRPGAKALEREATVQDIGEDVVRIRPRFGTGLPGEAVPRGEAAQQNLTGGGSIEDAVQVSTGDGATGRHTPVGPVLEVEEGPHVGAGGAAEVDLVALHGGGPQR